MPKDLGLLRRIGDPGGCTRTIVYPLPAIALLLGRYLSLGKNLGAPPSQYGRRVGRFPANCFAPHQMFTTQKTIVSAHHGRHNQSTSCSQATRLNRLGQQASGQPPNLVAHMSSCIVANLIRPCWRPLEKGVCIGLMSPTAETSGEAPKEGQQLSEATREASGCMQHSWCSCSPL